MKGEQLTDEHIHIAQQLLKKQFPHLDDLQSTILSETDGFEPLHHCIRGIASTYIANTIEMISSSFPCGGEPLASPMQGHSQISINNSTLASVCYTG